MPGAFVYCENLVKIYRIGETEVMALQGLDLAVEKGELLAVTGASGSGKTTLMNILGGLDRPTAGRAFVNEQSLLKMSNTELDDYRRRRVGFVWQQTTRNLVPYLSAQENVELPMMLAGQSARAKRRKAAELLEAVGLQQRVRHRLVQLSGGEQQRVAIAVALANSPMLLLADEPTGSLDSNTGKAVLELLHRLNELYELTTIIVTHDLTIAGSVERVVTIRDGKTSTERVRRPGAAADRSTLSVPASEGASVKAHHYREYVVLDSAGRLQIPPDFRKELNIGDRVELERMADGIFIRPVAGSKRSSRSPEAADTAGDQEPIAGRRRRKRKKNARLGRFLARKGNDGGDR